MPHVLDPTPAGDGLRIGIVVARFNQLVTERLLDGALATLRGAGVAEAAIRVVWVAGAFELPLACRWLLQGDRLDAVVALGAVIRGDTDHYDYVCRAATDGILRVGLDTGRPIGFGLLTCADLDQAMARAGGAVGNKGTDAALAALQMAQLGRATVARASEPSRPG
jgi:6,7-dimethyl-8-ribityllumazine synthase